MVQKMSKIINGVWNKKKFYQPRVIKKDTKISTKISIVDYDAKEIHIKETGSLEECVSFLKTPLITWINIRGIQNTQEIQKIGQQFKLHPLLVEDILTVNQRPKIDDYGDYLFIILQYLKYNEKTHNIENEQISLVLGKNYLISFEESDINLFQSTLDNLQQESSRIRTQGADYLCYSLMDSLIDQYFAVIEKVDEKLEILEDELLLDPKPSTLLKIQQYKREVTFVRKCIWPLREVVNKLLKLESPLFSEKTKVWLNDVYDHAIQVIEGIEVFRDVSSGLMDIYLSNINLRMNEVMKVLTVVATIFVPLTFIASIYGMNFDYIPELHWKYGYPYVLSIMFVMAFTMLVFFKRKKWI